MNMRAGNLCWVAVVTSLARTCSRHPLGFGQSSGGPGAGGAGWLWAWHSPDTPGMEE
jgi:hypothetical protein